MNIIFIY